MIKFISIDPSLRNTAVVYGELQGDIIKLKGSYIHQNTKDKSKQVRASSDLIVRGRGLIKQVNAWVDVYAPDIIFAETPSGSQSFKGAIAYGVSCMLIATLKPAPIEVTPQEVKKVLGKGVISKDMIINYVDKKYPNFLPRKKNGAINKSEAEHIADAVVAAEAGLKTTQFLQVKILLEK